MRPGWAGVFFWGGGSLWCREKRHGGGWVSENQALWWRGSRSVRAGAGWLRGMIFASS